MVVSFIKKLLGIEQESLSKPSLQTEIDQISHNDHNFIKTCPKTSDAYIPEPLYINFKDIPSIRKPNNCSEEITELYKKANEWRQKCVKLSNQPLIHRRFMDFDNFGRLEHDDMMYVFKCNGNCDNLFYYINEWAMALIKIDKLEIAQRVLEKATEIKTDTPKSYELLGKIYYDKGDIDGLKRFHKQLSEIEVPGAAQGRVLERLQKYIKGPQILK